MTFKNTIDKIVCWNPELMISLGLMLMFCSCIGFAWVRWPEGFTGVVGTIWDLLGQLLPR